MIEGGEREGGGAANTVQYFWFLVGQFSVQAQSCEVKVKSFYESISFLQKRRKYVEYFATIGTFFSLQLFVNQNINCNVFTKSTSAAKKCEFEKLQKLQLKKKKKNCPSIRS